MIEKYLKFVEMGKKYQVDDNIVHVKHHLTFETIEIFVHGKGKFETKLWIQYNNSPESVEIHIMQSHGITLDNSVEVTSWEEFINPENGYFK